MTLEDEDTLEAIQTYFVSDANLPTLIPNGLKTGRIASPPSTPWATVACKQGLERNDGPAPQTTGNTYHDYRLVTFTVWGVKAAVVAALAGLRVTFENQPKIPATQVAAMTVPNTSSLTRVEAMSQLDSLEEDQTRRQGGDVWKGVKAFQVWTQRIRP